MQAGQAGCRPAIMAGPHTEGPRPLGRPIWPGRDPRGPGLVAGQAGVRAGHASRPVEHARVHGEARCPASIGGGREGGGAGGS